MRELFRLTKEGGYLTCTELDMALNETDHLYANTALVQWNTLFIKLLQEQGLNSSAGSALQPLMERAGFRDIMYHKFDLPCGPWSDDERLKKVGSMIAQNACESMSMTKRGLSDVNGMNQEELEIFLAQARADAYDDRIKTFKHCVVVTGRKPYRTDT